MLQKINTALLVAILGVLVFLALRPQQGRYHYIQSINPIAFDTATGQLVYIANSPNLRAWYDEQEAEEKAEEARKKAEEEGAQNKWLESNCPDVLAGKVSASPQPRTPRKKTGFSPEEFIGSISAGPSREECEKWQQAKRPDAE